MQYLFAAVSWLLAEFFVLRRRMALPAIGLLLTFLGGVFAAPIAFNENPSEISFIISGVLTVIAARLHWNRFMVPITVAAGTAAAVGGIFGVAINLYPDMEFYYMPYMFVAGLFCFGLAMYWDASDQNSSDEILRRGFLVASVIGSPYCAPDFFQPWHFAGRREPLQLCHRGGPLHFAGAYFHRG